MAPDSISQVALTAGERANLARLDGYQPGLDGLRGVAILLVMAFHAQVPVGAGGFLGVDVFFVLSGYLITGLLFKELLENGKIRYLRFFGRRFFRLVPALLLMLCAFLVFAPILWPAKESLWIEVLLVLFYMADYAKALWGVPDLLSHAWSLSIEERFYLLWPIFLSWAWRERDAGKLLAAMVVMFSIVAFWRVVGAINEPKWDVVYYRFDTRISGLLAGSALFVFLWKFDFSRIVNISKIAFCVSLFGILFSLELVWGNSLVLMAGLPLVEVLTMSVIVLVLARDSLIRRFLDQRWLVFVGQISYGIYLWHYPIFRYMRIDYDWWIVFFVGGAISMLLAWFSWVTVERWGFRVRSKFFGAGYAGS